MFPSQPDAEVSIALVVIVQPPPLDLEEGTIPKDLKDDIVSVTRHSRSDVNQSVSVSIDLTLVSDDTFRRLY